MNGNGDIPGAQLRVAVMTENEVRDIVTDAVESAFRTREACRPPGLEKEQRLPRFVYGIRGIMELFGCSRSTAMKLKVGVLRDAVSQHGRKITVDVEMARKLFDRNR